MSRRIPAQLIPAVDHYLSDKASSDERQAIIDWFYKDLPAEEIVLTDGTYQEDEVFDRMLKHILQHIRQNEPIQRHTSIPIKRLLQVAAAVILIAGASLYYIWPGNTSQSHSAADIARVNGQATNITPGGLKATLTLSDGSVVVLDSTTKGFLRQEGNAAITLNKKGLLAYEQRDFSTGKRDALLQPVFNTLSIPRGGEFMLLLPDGTKVWVNAASVLRFPNFFSGPTREVELTGEAYFEVAKNEKMPFHVKAGQTDIAVLGTSFNVNAYENTSIQTTLLQGKVRVSQTDATTTKSVLLQPGQQAEISQNAPAQRSTGIAVNQVDTSAVVAWKNGNFQFTGNSLPEVMKQLSRWYNIDYRFEDGIVPSMELVGKYSRQHNLSEALALLTGIGIHYTIKGNTITIQH